MRARTGDRILSMNDPRKKAIPLTATLPRKNGNLRPLGKARRWPRVFWTAEPPYVDSHIDRADSPLRTSIPIFICNSRSCP